MIGGGVLVFINPSSLSYLITGVPTVFCQRPEPYARARKGLLRRPKMQKIIKIKKKKKKKMKFAEICQTIIILLVWLEEVGKLGGVDALPIGLMGQ